MFNTIVDGKRQSKPVNSLTYNAAPTKKKGKKKPKSKAASSKRRMKGKPDDGISEPMEVESEYEYLSLTESKRARLDDIPPLSPKLAQLDNPDVDSDKATIARLEGLLRAALDSNSTGLSKTGDTTSTADSVKKGDPVAGFNLSKKDKVVEEVSATTTDDKTAVINGGNSVDSFFLYSLYQRSLTTKRAAIDLEIAEQESFVNFRARKRAEMELYENNLHHMYALSLLHR